MPPGFSFRFRLSLVLLAAGVGGAACARPEPARVEVPALPADFNLVLGQGGGFAGRWDGYTIREDGTVLAWSGALQNERPQPVGLLARADLRDLWRRLEAMQFFDRQERETGNMTAFIDLTADGRRHRVSWVPGLEELEAPRSPLEAFYRHTLRLARQAEGL